MSKIYSAWVCAVLLAAGVVGEGGLSARPSSAKLPQVQEATGLDVMTPGLGKLAAQITNLSLATKPLWSGNKSDKTPSGASTPLPEASLDPAPSPPQPSIRLPVPSDGITPGGLDPAEQVAPSLIDLGATNQPIGPVPSLAMQQELNNLIGRFESALLMAESATLPAQVAQAEPMVKAEAESEAGEVAMHPALLEARQLMADWNGLIERREYAIARRRWQSVRQALWDNFPTDRPAAQAEIRAVWLDRGTIVKAGSREGLAQVFDRMAAAGVNTVFFETVNAGYPIYPSKVAPYRNPLIRRWDPLKEAVSLAHARGMTIHAWIWTFAAGNQVHNTLLNLPPDYPGPLLALHPDWAGYDNRGNVVPPGQTKPFLDPANQEVRSYLLRLISEIITSYDVDGLQLDYIRYPFQDPGAGRTYGYGTAARWRFRAMTGVDPLELATAPGPTASESQRVWHRQMWSRWTEFRVQQVTSFVQEVSLMIRRQRPDLVLSTAVFARPEQERLQKIQQDWGTWARQGYVDWVVLMSYAEDTNRFEQLIEPWLTTNDFGSALIIPGIRLLNLPQAGALDQILLSRDLPTPGYALFAATDLNSALEEMLHRTQGRTLAMPPGSPRQASFQMAHERYQTLQREWNLLLSTRQLWMEQPVLTRWMAEVNYLGEDLAALSENPSARRFQSAQTRLENVRNALDERVLVQTTNGNYRVQTWRYRLTAIDHLLDYGEKAQQ